MLELQTSSGSHFSSDFISASEYQPSSFFTVTFFRELMIRSISAMNLSWGPESRRYGKAPSYNKM